MTTVDTTADESGRPAVLEQEAVAAPAVVGPMAGDPAMLGLGSFIVGSVALGLGLVGVVPAGPPEISGSACRASSHSRSDARLT